MNTKTLKGYRLHDARIAYSGGSGSMRSIKFELLNPAATRHNKLRGQDLQAAVAAAITHDYSVLFGPLNFDAYLQHKDSPSLIDFWLNALSLGFVFSNQNSIEAEFFAYLGKKTIWEECYNQLSPELRSIILPTAFRDFLIKIHRKLQQKSLEQRQKIIYNLLRDKTAIPNIQPIADAWARDWSPEKNQLEFKCSIFHIPTPKLPTRTERLSFAIDPSFPVIKVTDKTHTLETIINYYESKKLDPDQMKRFLAIGDNGNYIGGVIGNLLSTLKNRNLIEIAESLSDLYQLNSKDIIYNRLSQLKILADQIPEPLLVRQWSDYRVLLNGTIESWYSNRARNYNSAIEQFFKSTPNEKGPAQSDQDVGIMVFLQKLQSVDIPSHIKDGILSQTIDHINTLKHNPELLTREFTDELNNYYLPTLREELNTWSQTKEENAHILPANWNKVLRRQVQQIPLFFGENKRLLWEQLLHLKDLIHTELNKLEELLTSREYPDYPTTDKQIDMLAQLYQRIKLDGNPKIINILKEIEASLKVDFDARTPTARYFLSHYERAKISQLPIGHRLNVSELLKMADLPTLIALAKKQPHLENTLRDVTQLSKIITSALVRGSAYEKTATMIHANLSGYASLISKKEFISRSTVQAVNGGQVCLAIDANKYFYAFNPDKFNANQKVYLFNKTYNFTPADLKNKPSKAPVLIVASSRYQVQFLDWFMGLHKRKKTSLIAGGAFCIAENTFTIDWSNDKPTLKQTGMPRVFVSQPFEIVPPPNAGVTPDSHRFIGVDIGEYGLAWSLIEAHDKTINQIEYGFISDPQQRALKNAVESLRQNQAKQTFTSTNTYVARLRDSLIGSYRNQLESLAMQKNARLCFEYEVSGFEAGSNRIAKVYNSIKQADIRKKDNDMANKMAWGEKGTNIWGYETTSSGTSQTCSKCHRWASLAIDDKQTYNLTPYQDGLFQTTIADGTVRLVTKKDTPAQIKGIELKKLIYMAMRPNEDGLGMQIVKRTYDWEKLSQTFGADKPRGNMAIFICPYTDCHHIADADLQAALNIAIRGYLKSIYPERAKKTGAKGLDKLFLTNEASLLHFTPVSISPSLPE